MEKPIQEEELQALIYGIYIFKKNIYEEGKLFNQDITIPKSVQMPERTQNIDENSLEYLYNLSDEELDDLDKLYENQMEEAKNEISRLEDILQTYKQSIKKLQGEIETDLG